MKPPFLDSKKSWKLDHSYDNQTFRDSIASDETVSTIYGGPEAPAYAEDPISLFETPEEKKKRKRSHIVAYLTMFVMTIGFSIVISGVWPYLHNLDSTLTKESMGWVIAANPLGQFIASPIVGHIGNKLGSIRLVCYCTVTFFILGNILYSFLPALDGLWPHSAFHIMIIARFITGLSSSNVTLCRSYLAASTTVKERTTGITIISMAQSLGFVIGPAIQAVLSLALQNNDSIVLKYRACGWVGAVLGVINFVLLTPFIFQEYNIAEKERNLLKERRGEGEKEFKLPKVDMIGIGGILFGFFINQFIYVLIESLLEPFSTDQFAWCDDQAVVRVGVTLSVAGLLAVPMFITATRLAKKHDERKILMFGAFVPISIGLFLMLPWGPGTLQYCEVGRDPNATLTTTLAPKYVTNYVVLDERDIGPISFPHLLNHHQAFVPYDLATTMTPPHVDIYCDDSYCKGCPADEQPWCIGYPQIPMAQFFIAFFIVCGAYPYGVSMSNALFSKMLGPKPQGLWMGILTASGAFARITGPVFVSYSYTNLGSRYLFGILIVMMFIALAEISVLFKRFVPMKVPDLNENSDKK